MGQTLPEKKKKKKERKGKKFLGLKNFFLYEREMPSTEVRFILKCDTEKVKKRNCIINSRFCVDYVQDIRYIYTHREILPN